MKKMTDEQTNEQTNRQTSPSFKALAFCAGLKGLPGTSYVAISVFFFESFMTIAATVSRNVGSKQTKFQTQVAKTNTSQAVAR